MYNFRRKNLQRDVDRSSTKSTEGSKVQGTKNTIFRNIYRTFYTAYIPLFFIFYILNLLLIRMNIVQDEEPKLDSKEDTVPDEPKVYETFFFSTNTRDAYTC